MRVSRTTFLTAAFHSRAVYRWCTATGRDAKKASSSDAFPFVSADLSQAARLAACSLGCNLRMRLACARRRALGKNLASGSRHSADLVLRRSVASPFSASLGRSGGQANGPPCIDY
jgi:hypothetical protein